MTDAHQDVAGVVAECLRPGGIMPINVKTTGLLVQAVARLSKALSEAEAEIARLKEVDSTFNELASYSNTLAARAEAAESRLAEAMKVIEPFSDVLGEDDDDQPDGTKITVDYKWHVYHALRLHHFRAARRFLNAWKE